MIRLPLALVLAVTALGAFAAAPPDTLHGLPNLSFPAPNRIASGSVQAGEIPALLAAGVGEVIDLRADSETPDFDEAAAMQHAGITYRHLPIRGVADLSVANVKRFDRLLADAGATRTLVHCASSNRVGAMIALRAAIIEGQSTATALAEGRRWGLKSLAPAVRERLDTWSASQILPAASSTP